MAKFNYYDNDAEWNFSNYQNKINLKSDDKNTQQLYDKILSIFDKNKNNKLDASEIRTIWDNVKVADSNEDGIITEKEASNILKSNSILSKLKISAGELLKFLNIINTTINKSFIKTTKTVSNRLVNEFKANYPSDKYEIKVYDFNGSTSDIFIIPKNNKKEPACIATIYPDGHYTVTKYKKNASEITSYSKDGTPIEGTKYNNGEIVEDINYLAESLYSDITAKTMIGIPTTGKDIQKHINLINSENVVSVLNEYYDISGKKSLISDIMEEYGLSIDTRIKYVKQIFSALIAYYSSQGIYVDDIVESFNNELKYQKGTWKPADSEKLDALVKELSDRYIGKEYMPQDENVYYNGKIDKDFKQGVTGDCWLVASIKAIALKPKGLKILNDSIKIDKNGNATVTLKGVNKTYKFTKEEIYGHTEYATGDLDVRILEMAVNKYFEEEHGVNDRVDINGNTALVAYEILIGNTNANYSKGEISNKQIATFNEPNHIVIVNKLENGDDSNVIRIKDSTGNSTELTSRHGYVVKRSDAEYVYLIDPHDTSAEIKVDRKTFKQFFNAIQEFDL